MTECFVGFDTSNYTTSAAVCDIDGNVVANIKMPLSVKSGERGLRQSDAVFSHVKNLPTVSDMLSEVLQKGYKPLAVGVSSRPRDEEGSYMPCFLCGVAQAHAFASALSIPIYEFSHQNGHVMAAAYSSGKTEELIADRFLAFHVSGGTTEALLIKPIGSSFGVELVGETLDLNAGQLIDRIGVALGLDFPCGPSLEKLACEFDGEIPRAAVSVKNCCCNLSGFENKALKLYEETKDKRLVSAFVFDGVCRTLIKMAEQLMDKHGELPILFAGGVMSNRYMRSALAERFEAHFSEPAFSADNAAGISLLCRREFLYNKK